MTTRLPSSSDRRNDGPNKDSKRSNKPFLELVLCSLCDDEIFVDSDQVAAVNFKSSERNICGDCRKRLSANDDNDGNQAKVQRLEAITDTLQNLFGALEVAYEELLDENKVLSSGAAIDKHHYPSVEVLKLRDGVSVPQVDLGRHNFGSPLFDEMTDRQLFTWALQTETRVRFEKLQGREAASYADAEKRGTSSSSLLGTSEHLIDLYPVTPSIRKKLSASPNKMSTLELDLLKYQRKAINYLQTTIVPDETLVPIEVEGYDDIDPAYPERLRNNKATLPVPPNYLFFEICLHGFLGYSPANFFHSKDNSLPRGAVMGGAVVAALSSWRDAACLSLFKEFDTFLQKVEGSDRRLKKKTQQTYQTLKQDLLSKVNEHFLRGEGKTSSKYDDGDVDIFLQASPTTRSAIKPLDSVPPDIKEAIADYIGGSGHGWCHGDLRRYATFMLGTVTEHLKVVEKRPKRRRRTEEAGRFVNTLTKNGLSFMFAPFWLDDKFEEMKSWPRPTQLLMLHPQADLLGALMDFDLSVSGSAYDGISVYATPRAALSLSRVINLITPFCFEEKRNQKRILKYYKRGFSPFLLDPSCVHASSCRSVEARISKNPTDGLLEGGIWSSHELRKYEESKGITLRQKLSVEQGSNKLLLCCEPRRQRQNGKSYTMAVFEKSEGHATEFFRMLHNWSDDYYSEVLRTASHLRMACRKCRWIYGIHLFLESESPVDDDADFLNLSKTLKMSYNSDTSSKLDPDFYGGPAFDATLVKARARDIFKANSMLRAQSVAEMSRYILKHNTLRGYSPRFTYADHNHYNHYDDVKKQPWNAVLDQVFSDAEALLFPRTKKPPVGLNPERFIAKCEKCQIWLHGREYGTKLCYSCQQNDDLSAPSGETASPDDVRSPVEVKTEP